jgi:hypothetical protein
MSNIGTPVATRRLAVAGDPMHARPMLSGAKRYEVEPVSAPQGYKYSGELSYGSLRPADMVGGFDADELGLDELLACPCATTA